MQSTWDYLLDAYKKSIVKFKSVLRDVSGSTSGAQSLLLFFLKTRSLFIREVFMGIVYLSSNNKRYKIPMAERKINSVNTLFINR